MRFLPLIIILVLLDIYAFQAFRVLAQNWSETARTILYSVYWSIPFITVTTLIAYSYVDTSKWNPNVFTFLRAFLIILYLSKFMIATILLVDDLRRFFLLAASSLGVSENFDPSRSRFLSQAGILLGSIPFFSLTYGIIRNPYRYKLFKEVVKIDGLPRTLEGMKIVQISDIHSGSFTMKEPVRAAIDIINKQAADLVFFTGDLVNNVADEITPFLDVFDKIKAKHGIYSVLGNHDYGDYVRWPSTEAKYQNLEKLKSLHAKLGWNLLLNENRTLQINDEKVAVIGVENYSASARFSKYGDLDKAYQGTDGAKLKLLLSHDPSHWHDQVTTKYQDIDITFSGHTHGMQFGVEIPGWIKWSPVKYVYKQWAGLYQQGQQYLYVNRGLGFLGYPGRVGILPEITLLELRQGNGEIES